MTSAEKILSIPDDRPEILFDQTLVKTQFRDMAKLWHPDVSSHPKAVDVFKHINLLYKAAVYKIDNGLWIDPYQTLIHDTKGKQYRIKHRYRTKFDLGEVLVSDTVVAYLVDKTHKELYDNAIARIKGFKFKSDNMKKEISKYLPQIKAQLETKDQFVLVLEKTADVIPLRCLLNYKGGKIDGKHAAWIISSLHNILCYLQVSGLAHNDISVDNYFVSLTHHSGLLLGGWWFSTPLDSKLTRVPARTYRLMTPSMKTEKIATMRLDAALSKAIGREILGDLGGTRLSKVSEAPAPLLNWVQLPSSGDHIKDYNLWMKQVLPKAYGERKFIKLDISIDDVYQYNQGRV